MSYYVSESFTYSGAFADKIVDCFNAVPADPLIDPDTMTFGLWDGSLVTPDPSTTKAEFVAAAPTFTNYTVFTPSMSTPVNLRTNTSGAVCKGTWYAIASGGFTTGQANGYYIESGGTVVGHERFADGLPRVFAFDGDYLTVAGAVPVQLTQATQ